MMAPGRIYPGTAVFLAASFTDDAGDLSDPATVICMTMSPSGKKATYTYGTDANVTKVATGQFQAEVSPDESGRWFVRWETTGNKMAVEENFIVQASPFAGFWTNGGDYA